MLRQGAGGGVVRGRVAVQVVLQVQQHDLGRVGVTEPRAQLGQPVPQGRIDRAADVQHRDRQVDRLAVAEQRAACSPSPGSANRLGAQCTSSSTARTSIRNWSRSEYTWLASRGSTTSARRPTNSSSCGCGAPSPRSRTQRRRGRAATSAHGAPRSAGRRRRTPARWPARRAWRTRPAAKAQVAAQRGTGLGHRLHGPVEQGRPGRAHVRHHRSHQRQHQSCDHPAASSAVHLEVDSWPDPNEPAEMRVASLSVRARTTGGGTFRAHDEHGRHDRPTPVPGPVGGTRRRNDPRRHRHRRRRTATERSAARHRTAPAGDRSRLDRRSRLVRRARARCLLAGPGHAPGRARGARRPGHRLHDRGAGQLRPVPRRSWPAPWPCGADHRPGRRSASAAPAPGRAAAPAGGGRRGSTTCWRCSRATKRSRCRWRSRCC